MNIFCENEVLKRHNELTVFKKLTNCNYTYFDVETNEPLENSLFIYLVGGKFPVSESNKEKIRAISNKSLLILHTTKSLIKNGVGTAPYTIKSFADEYNFRYDKVFIISQLEYDVEEIRKIMPSVNAMSYDTWLNEFFDMTLFPTMFTPGEFFTGPNPLEPKKFSVLCKRYEPPRFKVFCHLIANNLLNDFNYTFVADHLAWFHNSIPEISNDIPDEFSEHKDLINKWIEGIPYKAPDGIDKIIFTHYHYIHELEFYYKASLLHLVLETEPCDASFITEKTYRTIFYKKPFLLISQHNALKILRQEGFKTFSPFIDESYDEIEDYELRLQAVIAETKRLSNLSYAEMEDLVIKCKEITDFNYQMLFERYFKPIPEAFTTKGMLSFN